MRASTRVTLTMVALVIAHGAFAQVPATHRSGKEIYNAILQSEQRGRAMIDLTFKGRPIDDKKLQSDFLEGIAAADELEQLAKAGDIEAMYYMGMYHIHYGLAALASARRTETDRIFLHDRGCGNTRFSKRVCC